jgi:hypothetical protein
LNLFFLEPTVLMMSQASSQRCNILIFDEEFVLELTVRFELSIPKGGFSWALQGLASLAYSLNVFLLEPTI